MRTEKLRTKTITELQKDYSEKKSKLYQYQLDLKSGKEKDTAKVKFLRKDIARILTMITTKRLAGEAPPQVQSEVPKEEQVLEEEKKPKQEEKVAKTEKKQVKTVKSKPAAKTVTKEK